MSYHWFDPTPREALEATATGIVLPDKNIPAGYVWVTDGQGSGQYQLMPVHTVQAVVTS